MSDSLINYNSKLGECCVAQGTTNHDCVQRKLQLNNIEKEVALQLIFYFNKISIVMHIIHEFRFISEISDKVIISFPFRKFVLSFSDRQIWINFISSCMMIKKTFSRNNFNVFKEKAEKLFSGQNICYDHVPWVIISHVKDMYKF